MATARCGTTAALVLLVIMMWSWLACDAIDGQTLLGSWTMKAPLPTVRAEVAAVAVDGRLHALGGVLGSRSAPNHDEYAIRSPIHGGCERHSRNREITSPWRAPTEKSTPSVGLLPRSTRMPATRRLSTIQRDPPAAPPRPRRARSLSFLASALHNAPALLKPLGAAATLRVKKGSVVRVKSRSVMQR